MVEVVYGFIIEIYEVIVIVKKKGNLSWFILYIINYFVLIIVCRLN